MLIIVGCIVVVGSVLGGFNMAGGHVSALIHPSELVTIGGAALGALLVMSPRKVLKDLLHGLLQAFKGTPYTKSAYEQLFQALYELFLTARRQGLLALEPHVSEPQESEIFAKYPAVRDNSHVRGFICGSFMAILDGSVRPAQLASLMEADLKTNEEEHHAPLNVLTKTADSLPGFGIVAAVLGIVVTMGAIDGPVEEIGEKVGAALVGTFLGILLSYGFVTPLSVNMEFLAAAETAFLRAIATALDSFVKDLPPKLSIELARRGVSSEHRPTQQELEAMFSSVDAKKQSE